MKDAEQADLTKTVIEKVVASLKEEKTQKEILASAVAEVERMYYYWVPRCLCTNTSHTEMVKSKAI